MVGDGAFPEEELTRAGVYDPVASGAADRRALLTWLLERGVTVEQIAANPDDLAALAGDLAQTSGQTISMREMAGLAGVPVDRLVELHRAAGLEPVDADAPLFSADDLAAITMVHAASRIFTWSELLQFLRVLGSSASRVANAANTLFVHDVEHPLRRSGATELDIARVNLQAAHLAAEVPRLIGMYLRLHLQQATRQVRLAQHLAADGEFTTTLAVGFVDLVGYTARAGAMTAAELGALVSKFEATAHDVVTDLGGRLVKLIGDEVMFVAVDPTTGCTIGAALLRTFGRDPALTPRGGLAYGEVLPRSGDYFGPTVNLAARLAEQAVPGEILAVPEAAAEHDGIRVEPAGRRLLKGFAEPVRLVSITVA